MATRLSAAFITIFWLAMMTSLVVNNILPERRIARSSLVDPEILALQWSDLYDWSFVTHDGRQVGGMVTQVERIRPPADQENVNLGYLACQNAEANLSILGMRRNVRFKLTLRLNSEFHVADFIAMIASQGVVIECAGFVRGNELYYRITPKGATPVYRSLTLRGPISLIEAVRPMVAKHFDLAVGQEFTTDVVDPIFGIENRKITLKVVEKTKIEHEGEEVEVFRIEQKFESLVKSSWVTKRGVTIRRELLQGYMLEKSNKPMVREAWPDLVKTLPLPALDRETFIKQAHAGNAQQAQPGAIPQFNILSLFMGGGAAPQGAPQP